MPRETEDRLTEWRNEPSLAKTFCCAVAFQSCKLATKQPINKSDRETFTRPSCNQAVEVDPVLTSTERQIHICQNKW
jgi:hypothetical protein